MLGAVNWTFHSPGFVGLSVPPSTARSRPARLAGPRTVITVAVPLSAMDGAENAVLSGVIICGYQLRPLFGLQ